MRDETEAVEEYYKAELTKAHATIALLRQERLMWHVRALRLAKEHPSDLNRKWEQEELPNLADVKAQAARYGLSLEIDEDQE